MKIIFLFIDGFGLGEEDKSRNPVIAAHTPNIDYIFKNFNVVPVDATLGVEGLPQSATGQTAVFTGINAPKVLGRHLSGQPTQTLKDIINNTNLFKELANLGYKVTNANVYRQEYLDMMLDPSNRKYRPSVTSVMSLSAGVKLRTVDDYKQGLGVYHDITGHILLENGYDVDIITPGEAAQRLKNISRDYDLTLFEHFMTDIIGHSMNMEEAIREIQLLDEFLGELIRIIDLKEDIIFITSDHGNIEDMSIKTHTYNKVPVAVIGDMSGLPELKIKSLLDITPYVINMFKAGGRKSES